MCAHRASFFYRYVLSHSTFRALAQHISCFRTAHFVLLHEAFRSSVGCLFHLDGWGVLLISGEVAVSLDGGFFVPLRQRERL